MNYNKNSLLDIIESILIQTRTRLFTSEMTEKDREALYSEYREWMDIGFGSIIDNGVIYSLRIKDAK